MMAGALTLMLSAAFTQEIGIGEWRDHLPYNSGRSVAGDGDRIFCATPYSIFYFDKQDNSINRITTINGLSDAGISCIRYHEGDQILVIAYQNANIDLLRGNTIINISDIKETNAVTPEEKTINSIYLLGDRVYFSCGFGMVVLDILTEEILDTWYIGPDGAHLEVLDLTGNDTSFFAATEAGVYSARMDDPNLAFFEAWSRHENLPFPMATYNHIESFSGRIFANKYSTEWDQDTIMSWDGAQWKYESAALSTGDLYTLESSGGILYAGYNYYLDAYDSGLNQVMNIWTYGTYGPRPSGVFIDREGTLWISDFSNGLVRRNGDYDYTFIHPNGPSVSGVFDMSIGGSDLWTVPGGRAPWWANLWIPGSVSSFVDSEWYTYSGSNTAALDTIPDILTVCVNPFDHKRVYAGSWFRGLLEFNNGVLENIYNHTNSSLEEHNVAGDGIVKVGGIAFDGAAHMWVTNANANNVLSVRTAAGDWQSFYLESFSSGQDLGELMIDAVGQKWILMRQDHSILVFDDNNTITNTGDDEVRLLGSAQGNGAIPGNKVFSIASDIDGEVWIGTDAGIAVFYSPENIFSGQNFDAQRILIPRNDGSGQADILFEFETINAIHVDGDNRKWIGTDRSGVFLLSSDGQEEIYHFTTENSPLLSNTITSIAINQESGEVFIGTSSGLISFKGTATEGGETNEDVYAYPNPVRPGYSGPIAIRGLVRNADVKITDIAGNVVYRCRAEGGQAIWDGRDFNGQRARSGVYLAFISNDDGSETFITKILFVN